MSVPDRRLRLPDPRVRVDGHRVGASSRLGYAGAYQLTLSSVVPSLGVELHSSYLGHPDSDTAVSHLQLGADTMPYTHAELVPYSHLPVAEERRGCLYHHLAELQRVLEQDGARQVAIEFADEAIEILEHA